MDAPKIAQYVTRFENRYILNISINEKCAGVDVTEIGMDVAINKAEDYDSDLWVAWNMDGLVNSDDAYHGTLLMRDPSSKDQVTGVMGEFYWGNAFDNRLREILMECGFSEEAANDVNTSEWGMQREGIASYDAWVVADEIRAAMNTAKPN